MSTGEKSMMKGFLDTVKHPVTSIRSLGRGGSLYGLLIVFGFNAVDELDRAAFDILAPEIRDEFDLGFQGLLTIIAVVAAASLALQVPIAGFADRHSRVCSDYIKESFQKLKAKYLPGWLSNTNYNKKKISAWGTGKIARRQIKHLVNNHILININFSVHNMLINLPFSEKA